MTLSPRPRSTPSAAGPPPTPPGPMCQVWSQTLAAPPRGLSLAREKGWLLAWDESHWLYLFDRKGDRQAQLRAPGAVATACCSDDGSAWVAVGARGEVWWLAPDLTTRWEATLPAPALAAAVDPFGQYLAVSDARGNLCVYNRLGRALFRITIPRPLHHLAFAPQVPCLVGAADLGLIAAFDLTGHWLWRDGLVAHVGALAVSADGSQVLMACFSEGILRYGKGGAKQKRLAAPEPCRLVAVTFDGRHLLTGGLGPRLLLLDANGNTLRDHALERPPVALALGALGDFAVVAVNGGPVLRLSMRGD